MAIAETDLVFLEPERLDDSPNGGGRMTGHVILDGRENNLFNDVGPGARVTGRVFLREAFAANRSSDASVYLDAHVALVETPADPAIDITLFSTGPAATVRNAARDYIERYLARGGYWPAALYGNHLAGQKAVQLVSLVGVETPNVGQTLVLIQDEGEPDEIEQYVRVVRVESQARTFIDVQGEFSRQVTLAEISDPLRADFVGVDPSRYTATSGRTRIRDTVAAAAARYYSARPLVFPAQAADRTIFVDSLYTQLVPAAQTEAPLIDLNAAGVAAPLMASGAALTLATTAPLSSTAALYLGSGIQPGSLTIAVSGATLRDDARGQLVAGSTVVGTIDYTQGVLVGVSGSPSYPDEKTCAWIPAGTPATVTQSAGIAVTAETRAHNYVLTLAPVPRPATLRVDYLAGGKWYRLQDRGDGALVGVSSAHGAGSLNFVSGSALITLGALPDIGSTILWFWANATDATDRSGSAFDPPRFRAPLAHSPVVPDTLSLEWTVNGVDKSATANAAGVLTGDASGTIHPISGELTLAPALLPAPGTILRASYHYGPPQESVWDSPTRNGASLLALTLPHTNIVSGSVQVEWPTNLYELADAQSSIWDFAFNIH